MIVSHRGRATLEDVRRAYDAICRDQPERRRPPVHRELPPRVGRAEPARHHDLPRAFPDSVVGFSGHDSGIAMALAAYVLAAASSRSTSRSTAPWKGTDHAFSLEPRASRRWSATSPRARRARRRHEAMHPCEVEPSVKMGKKLVPRVRSGGHVLAAEDIVAKSPGDGLPPYERERPGTCARRPVTRRQRSRSSCWRTPSRNRLHRLQSARCRMSGRSKVAGHRHRRARDARPGLGEHPRGRRCAGGRDRHQTTRRGRDDPAYRLERAT